MTDHSTGTTGPDQQRSRDALRTIGIVVVGLSAAVLSFQTWVQVAQSIGFTAHWSIGLWSGRAVHFWIAWLYPIAIDCFAMLVTREWMRSKPDSDLRVWARANSIGAIVLSYGGQAAYHAFDGARPPTVYVIFMGGMPPLIVGLVVHLYTKSGAIETTPVRSKRTTAARRTNVVQQNTPVQPVQQTGPSGQTTPTVQDGPDQPTKPIRSKTAVAARGGLHVVQGAVASMAQRVDQTYPDDIPSRRDVMDHFGWKSAQQASDAIKAVRASRAARTTAVDQDDADDSERELATTASA